MHQSIKHSKHYCFPQKPYILFEFEPRYSVPKADAMSNAPRRPGLLVFVSESTYI
jgi:hypothetical protein